MANLQDELMKRQEWPSDSYAKEHGSKGDIRLPKETPKPAAKSFFDRFNPFAKVTEVLNKTTGN